VASGAWRRAGIPLSGRGASVRFLGATRLRGGRRALFSVRVRLSGARSEAQRLREAFHEHAEREHFSEPRGGLEFAEATAQAFARPPRAACAQSAGRCRGRLAAWATGGTAPRSAAAPRRSGRRRPRARRGSRRPSRGMGRRAHRPGAARGSGVGYSGSLGSASTLIDVAKEACMRTGRPLDRPVYVRFLKSLTRPRPCGGGRGRCRSQLSLRLRGAGSTSEGR
jgi:hypothetical protein